MILLQTYIVIIILYTGTNDFIQTQFEVQGRESSDSKSKKKKKKKPGKGTFLLSGLALGALATHVLKKPSRPSYNPGYQSARPSYHNYPPPSYPHSYNQPLLHHTGTPYPQPQYQPPSTPIYSNPTSYVSSSTTYSPSSYYPSASSSYPTSTSSSFPSTSFSYPTSSSTTYINHPSSYPSRPTSYPHYGKTEYGSPQTLVPVFIY